MQTFGIHPADGDLTFLKRVNETLEKKYGGGYRYLRLEANYHTHESCLKILNEHDSSNVFFFCHALEKSIRGCKIEHNSSALSYKDFNYGTLISPETNISVFKGKKVFCLACFSKDLGKYAITAGAHVFIGFGDIQFYLRKKFKEDIIESAVKRELGCIILDSLSSFIDNDWSYNELSIYLRLLIERKRFELLMNKSKGDRVRLEVSNALSKIKNGIMMFGNGNLKYSS